MLWQMKKYFLLCGMLYSVGAYGQEKGLGSWNILNAKYTINDKWNVFGEAQLRSLKFYNHFHYYEYKGWAEYSAHKYLKFVLGAGSYQTYKAGGDFVLPKNNDEFRLWPQVVFSQAIGSLKVEQRYRSECRFTSNGYRNRFRYRLGFSYPLGKARNGYKPYQLSASNELFFTDREPYFERNRLVLALNYKPSATTTFQVGYLRQFDYKINDEIGKDFLQVGIFIDVSPQNIANKAIDADLKDN